MAITGPVVVRAADGTQWQASHREAEIGAVSTRPSTLFGFVDKEAGISMRASYRTSVRDFHSPRHKHTLRSDVDRHPAALSNRQDFFVLADAEYFENYSKYVRLFDEIFMKRN